MPIHRLFQNGAFEPEAIQAMSLAFEDALKTLGLKDRADPLTEAVASIVIDLGHQGVRDRKQLHDLTIRALKP